MSLLEYNMKGTNRLLSMKCKIMSLVGREGKLCMYDVLKVRSY